MDGLSPLGTVVIDLHHHREFRGHVGSMFPVDRVLFTIKEVVILG